MLSLDFETRSGVDLKAAGAYVYATDPSTGIYMLGWAFDDELPALWLPGEPFPQRIIDHINSGGIIQAYNAQFERLIMWYILCPDFDVPDPTMEQFHCTAAQVRAHGMPGELGKAARALKFNIPKNPEGSRLIKEYSALNVPWEDIPPEDQGLFTLYCLDDVRVERGVSKMLRPLTDHEWYEYHLDDGELHCGTNQLPRAVSKRWWRQDPAPWVAD
jgi:DNA polymerase